MTRSRIHADIHKDSQYSQAIVSKFNVAGIYKLVRKWGVPLATAASMPILAPVVFADSGKKDSSEPTSRMVRPSDLPIYEEPEEVLDFEYHGKERTSLEDGVGVVRKEIEGMLEATRSARERVVHIYETGKAHSMGSGCIWLCVCEVTSSMVAVSLDAKDYNLIGKLLFTKGSLISMWDRTNRRNAVYVRQHDVQQTEPGHIKWLRERMKLFCVAWPWMVGSDIYALYLIATSLDYITDEENVLPRAGAITIGGLAGLIIGARKKGGLVKRVLYTSTGVVTAASLCYPRQAYHISQQAYEGAKDYATIGYNFVAGVKPQSKVATPVESIKEESSVVDENAAPLPKVDVSLAPETPSPTTEPEGAEVRSVIPQILHPETSPAPIDSLAQQARDVTQWGFRLTDTASTTSSSPADIVAPADPVIPEGFGSVGEISKDSAGAAAEQKVFKADAEGVNLIKEVSLPEVAEPARIEGIPEITVEVVQDSAEKVVDVTDVVEEKVEVSAKTGDVEEVSHIAEVKVAGIVEEKVAGIVEEKVAEVVITVAKEVEKDAMKVAEAAEVVEELGSKGESALGIAENIAEAATEAVHSTPDVPESVVEKAELVKQVTEEAENVVETVTVVAEKVEKVAEEVRKEAEGIEAQATEVLQTKEEKKEHDEAAEVITGSKSPSSDEMKDFAVVELGEPGVESTLDESKVQLKPSDTEDAEEVRKEAEGIEAQATEVLQTKEEKKEEHDEATEVITGSKSSSSDEMKDFAVVELGEPGFESTLDESKVQLKPSDTNEKMVMKPETDTETSQQSEEESIPEVASKLDFVENEAKDTSSEDSLVEQRDSSVKASFPVEKQGLFDKLRNFFSKEKSTVKVVELVEESVEEKTKESSTTSDVTPEAVSAEKIVEKVVDSSELKIQDAETQEIPLTDLAKVGKDEEITDTVSKATDPVLEEVVKDAVEDLAESAVKIAAEVVQEAIGDIVEGVNDVIKITDVVEEVGDKVVTVLDAIQEVKEETHKTPGVSEAVSSEVSEGVKTVVEAVTFVAETVEDVADAIKTEAIALETQAAELVHSEEKRKEIVDGVVELIGGSESSSDAEKDTPSELSAAQLQESGIETTPKVLTEPVSDVSMQEEKPEEKLVEVPVLEPAEDSVPVPVVKEGVIDRLARLLSKSQEKDEPAVGIDSVVEKVSKPTHEERKVPSEEPLTDKTEEVVTITSEDAKEKEDLTDKIKDIPDEIAVPIVEQLKEPPVEPTTQETKEPVFDRVEEEILPTKEIKEPRVETAVEVLSELASESSTQEKDLPKPDVKEGLFDKLSHLFSKSEEKKSELASKPIPEEFVEPSVEPTAQETKESEFVKTDDVLKTTYTDMKENEGLGGKREEAPAEGAVLTAEELKEPSVEPTTQETKESDVDGSKELVSLAEDFKEPSVKIASEILQETELESNTQEKKTEVAPVIKEGLFDKLAQLFSKDEERKDAQAAGINSVAEPVSEPTSMEVKELSVEPGTELESNTQEKKTEVAPVVKEGLFNKLTQLFSKDEEKKDAQAVGIDSIAEPVSEPTSMEVKELSVEPATQEAKELVPSKMEDIVTSTSTDTEEKEGLIGKKEVSAEGALSLEEVKEPSGEPTIQEAETPLVERIKELVLPKDELKEFSVETASVVLPEPVLEASAQEKEPEEKSADIPALESVAPAGDSAPKSVVKEGLFDILTSLFSKDEEKKEVPAASVDSVLELVKTEEPVTGTSKDAEEKESIITKKDENLVEVELSASKDPLREPTIQEAKEPVHDRIELPTEKLKEPSVETPSVILPEPVPEGSVQEKEPEERFADVSSIKAVAAAEDSVPEPVLKEGLFDKLTSLFSKDEEKKDIPTVNVHSLVESVTESTENLREPLTESSTEEEKKTVIVKTEELMTGTSADAEEKESLIGKNRADIIEVVEPTSKDLTEPSGEPSVQVAKEPVLIEELILPIDDLKDPNVKTASILLPEPVPDGIVQDKEPEEKPVDIAAVETVTPTENIVPKPLVKESLFDKLANLFSKDEDKKDLPTVGEDSVIFPVPEPVEKLKEQVAESATQEAKETTSVETEEIVVGTSAVAEDKEGLADKKEEDPVEEVADEELKEPSREPTLQEVNELVLDRKEDLSLPAEELKEPSVEVASVVLPESSPEASVQGKEPEEKPATVSAVASAATTEDIVTEPVVKEGLFDKLASFFSKDEDKKDLPAVEPTVQEAKESVFDETGSSMATEEGHIDTEVKEQITREVKSLDIQLPATEELEESEESSDEVPPALNKPSVDATLTPVKTEGIFRKLSGFFKEEDRKDAVGIGESVVESTAEKLKEPHAQEATGLVPEKPEETVIGTNIVTEEKESEIDKLAIVLSKDEENKVPVEEAVPLADSVIESKEPTSDLPNEVTELPIKEAKPSDIETSVSPAEKEGLLDKLTDLFSKEKDVSLNESVKLPVEESEGIEELSTTAGEGSESVITTPDETVKDEIIVSDQAVQSEIPSDQQEVALMAEEKSLFGKIAGVFSGSQSKHVSDGTVVPDSSAVIDRKLAESTSVLPDAALSVEEPPKLDTKAEELVPETDVQEVKPKEKSIESSVEGTEPVVAALPPSEEKEGLFDKLANFLSKDEGNKDIKAAEVVPSDEPKETDGKEADKSLVELGDPAADATSKPGDNEGLFGKLSVLFSKDEEKKEIPVAIDVPAFEKSEVEGKSTNLGTAELEPATDTASPSTEKEGLFDLVANLFSKQEEKIEDEDEKRVSGADSGIQDLTGTSSDLSKHELVEQTVDLKLTEVDTPTATKENEGLFGKLVGFFSKEDTDMPVTKEVGETLLVTKESPTDPGETSEQLSSNPEVSNVASGDLSSVEVDHEISVTQDKKSLFDKISAIFSDKEGPLAAPAGDAPTNSDVIKSTAEIVSGVSSEAGLSETPALGSSPVNLSGETADVSSENASAKIDAEEPLLQVKDKGLFDRLAELVSRDERKEVAVTDEVSIQSKPETVTDTLETVNQEFPEKSKADSPEIVNEPKSSIFDRVTNFFSNKENSKEVEKDMVSNQLVEEVPVEVTKQSENSSVTEDSDDTFVVNANPSSPADVRAQEESGEQSGDAAASAWRGWFRTGASVKQEGKDVIVQLTPPKPVETDYGQGNPEDSDMYTTRS
ncbi:uncharacterized protein [Panulirus ornatus]|uniref:uncharacterized protein n=1 Tax=Panulirus ornatus TaxID=150431 RepID=UPI003A86AAD1